MSLPWAASLSGRDSSGKDAGALRIGGFHAMLPYRFAIIRAGVAPRGPEGTSRGRSGTRSQRPVPGGGRERGTIRKRRHALRQRSGGAKRRKLLAFAVLLILRDRARTEEQTSELQSLMRITYAVYY